MHNRKKEGRSEFAEWDFDQSPNFHKMTDKYGLKEEPMPHV